MPEPEETQPINPPKRIETAPEFASDPVPDGPTAQPLPVEPEPAIESEPESDTDQAVDDITHAEADEALQTRDEVAQKAIVMKSSRAERLKNAVIEWWGNPRNRYGTIGAVVAMLAVLFIVPYTRYSLLGLVLKAPTTIQVVDSKSGAPVSGATVELAGQTAQTEANGKAVLKVHAGSKQLQVTKKYYQGYTRSMLVTLSATHNVVKAPLLALGRQVKVKVVNKVSGQPVVGAVVTAQGAKAKTGKDGMATVVLPSGATTQQGTISLSGYNNTAVTIDADGTPAKNTFAVTPVGKLYFLSNLSGKIDVVKTNLDGTDRQTVLAGTGSEDANSTSLLASRDWKYLALLSKRAGDNASVYLIDTTNGDKLTTVDQGNANFTLVGWSGDRFVYLVNRNTVQDWQASQQALKSLDATTGQTLLLDQTQGSGTNQYDFTKQSFGSPYLMDDQVVYAKNWSASYTNASLLNGKQAELDSIASDGTGRKVIKTFGLPSGTQSSFVGINAQLYSPTGLYVDFSPTGQDTFYEYEDGKISPDSSLTATQFYQSVYPTFLFSPSGNKTFWSEQRDGKNTLFVGDQAGKNPKQVASLSDYKTYGWFSDDYLLVSKNSSELYILPATGGTPLKITDYYKPAINYQGYGGGYGGL